LQRSTKYLLIQTQSEQAFGHKFSSKSLNLSNRRLLRLMVSTQL